MIIFISTRLTIIIVHHQKTTTCGSGPDGRGWWFLCSSADADDVHLDDAHPPSSAVSHSSLYSIRSPGWQSSSRQRASSVENRRALILLFLIRDRLAGVMPTLSARSLRETWRSTISLSRCMRIIPGLPHQTAVSGRSRRFARGTR